MPPGRLSILRSKPEAALQFGHQQPLVDGRCANVPRPPWSRKKLVTLIKIVSNSAVNSGRFELQHVLIVVE